MNSLIFFQLRTLNNTPLLSHVLIFINGVLHFFPFPSTVTLVIYSEAGASVKRNQNDWISCNWNEMLTAEAAENNGRLSLSMLSDRLEVFVHSLSVDFSGPCLQQWRSDTTSNTGIKLNNGVFLHWDVHLEGVSSLFSFLTYCRYYKFYCLTPAAKNSIELSLWLLPGQQQAII